MAKPNSFTNDAELKAKPFTQIYGLWLAPIVGSSPRGGYDVAEILQSDFNYKRVGEFFGDIFWQSSQVQLRVANDHIDVSTFDTRINQMNRGERRSEDLFADFGRALSRNARNHTDGVIDIRKSPSWSSLKSTAASKAHVYPPQILPLCVLSNRKEDTNWWLLHSLEAIHVSPMENVARSFMGKPAVTRENDRQGYLPTDALEFLSDVYKVPFEPKVMLTLIASHAGL